MKKKNIILSLIFSLLTMFITFYIIFKKHNINLVIESVKNVNFLCIFICFVLVVLYFVCQGIYIKLMLGALGRRCKLIKGIYYTMIEFLFSGITPGGGGGQPVVIYYMKKNGIPIKQSTIIMLINTIMFKFFLVIGAIVILLAKPEYVFGDNKLITIFFFLGVGLDIFLTVLYMLLLYNQKLIKILLDVLYKFYFKVRHREGYKEEAAKVLAQYSQEARFIKDHKKEIILSLLVTFLQRMFMFSVTYVIYRGLGFNSMNYLEMVLLQIFVQISVEAIFLPGGTGISEYVSGHMFVAIFGCLSTTGMLLFRFLTFYTPLLLIAIMYVITVVCKCKKKLKAQ